MRARRKILVPAFALALAAVAGCGQSATSDDGVATAATAAAGRSAGSNPSPTPSLSFEQKLQQWVECMRAEGIDMADPARNADGKINAEFPPGTEKGGPLEERSVEAQQKCSKFNPNEEPRPFSAEQLEAQRQWAQCMRAQGIQMNDPDPNGAPALPKRGGVNNVAALRKAEQACADKSPILKGRGGR
jgi:hypothetical protein